MMKTVAEGISQILDEKLNEVDQIYDPACQKLSVQVETISKYLEKIEKSLHRTNEVLKRSKLQELLTAQKTIDDDIKMLQNEKPQNLTSFQVQVDNPESYGEKLSFYATFKELTDKCKYIYLRESHIIITKKSHIIFICEIGALKNNLACNLPFQM